MSFGSVSGSVECPPSGILSVVIPFAEETKDTGAPGGPRRGSWTHLRWLRGSECGTLPQAHPGEASAGHRLSGSSLAPVPGDVCVWGGFCSFCLSLEREDLLSRHFA